MNPTRKTTLLLFVFLLVSNGCTQPQQNSVKEKYEKHDYQISMRDGIKLFTSVYSPRDKSKKYPILLVRTPYSVAPYGEDKYTRFLGASREFGDEGFIFVFQDVRGRYMSEGEFDNMRAYIPNKKDKNQVDESSDTYDTIDW
jgi:putative CocE/NonD family hydrolase